MKKILSAATLCAALTGAAVMPAIAGTELGSPGVSLVPPAANTGAVSAYEQASTVRDVRKAGGHTLRCWQQGRLLYEGSGFRHDLERTANTIGVPRIDGDPAVVLVDLKDGMCILSKN